MPCSLTATYYVLALGWNVAADIRATPEITATSAVGGDTITNLTQITKLGEVAADKRAAPEKNSGETITRLKDCSLPPTPLKPVDPGASYGYIHDIIGKDGALMLTMLRLPERFENAAAKLRPAGIIATHFPAADGYCEPRGDIERGCFMKSERVEDSLLNLGVENVCNAKQGWGQGCIGKGTAACTESHHRALEVAQYRKHDWTLIMEDDAVPVEPETFQENFRKAWQKLPAFAKLVRLGWCTFPLHGMVAEVPVDPVHVAEVYDSAGKFNIVRKIWDMQYNRYDAGFCTTAYMIHRDAIPDMLGLFPCCCGSDCCFNGGLFSNARNPEGSNETWGYKNMVSIGMEGSAEATIGWNQHGGMYQFGPLVQDNRELGTARSGG
mmetsp:Transcript_83156/g.147219  ORF Transcript_83156/g.147219 Transcript_83156/m.147219 type:complete len:382 (-) Transcript_83156:114-1259(-)